MVFLSTIQALIGHPLSRNVFAFGSRPLTQIEVVEELAMGLFLVFPMSLLVAAATIRLAAKSVPFIRSDIFTTLLITLVGDIFLEVLLPSLQCLPMNLGLHEDLSYLTWLAQAWGFQCPADLEREALLSTDAVGTLLTVRLLFMCLGVYLGEAFVPIALTGGIASGKTTVSQMLQDPRRLYTPKSVRRRKPKSNSFAGGGNAASNAASGPGSSSGTSSVLDADDEGSFEIIDIDRIAHEILLPSYILKGDDPVPGVDPPYTTAPTYSLYKQIVHVFADHDILDESGLIDRRKLGSVIFQDPSLRRQLNRLTHPRILVLMLRRILGGTYWGSKDVVCADIPLLFESGELRRLFALNVCVAAPRELQFERLRRRNPDLSEEECWNRINSQMPMEDKAKKADIVIWNTGDLEALSEEVEKVRRDIIGRIFGVGMSLLQMLLLVGGSLSLAVSSKLFS